MKPEQAIQILSEATQPVSAGRLTRADYVVVEQALALLKQFVEQHSPKPEDKPAE